MVWNTFGPKIILSSRYYRVWQSESHRKTHRNSSEFVGIGRNSDVWIQSCQKKQHDKINFGPNIFQTMGFYHNFPVVWWWNLLLVGELIHAKVAETIGNGRNSDDFPTIFRWFSDIFRFSDNFPMLHASEVDDISSQSSAKALLAGPWCHDFYVKACTSHINWY